MIDLTPRQKHALEKIHGNPQLLKLFTSDPTVATYFREGIYNKYTWERILTVTLIEVARQRQLYFDQLIDLTQKGVNLNDLLGTD